MPEDTFSHDVAHVIITLSHGPAQVFLSRLLYLILFKLILSGNNDLTVKDQMTKF